MIAAYCRVSTARQKADSQVAEISKWLKANGYDENEVEWYIDKESGNLPDRAEICAGEFELCDFRDARRFLERSFLQICIHYDQHRGHRWRRGDRVRPYGRASKLTKRIRLMIPLHEIPDHGSHVDGVMGRYRTVIVETRNHINRYPVRIRVVDRHGRRAPERSRARGGNAGVYP